MNDITLFMEGYKPALYDTVMSKRFMGWLPQLQEYPYIDEGINLIPDVKFYLFFQTENQKRDFQSKVSKFAVPSIEFHRLLGQTLGYPPKAVDFYIRCEQEPSLKPLKVGMHYQGVSCNGSVYDLIDNCNWLWDTYSSKDLPNEPLQVRIGYNMYSAGWGDIERIKEIQQIAFSELPISEITVK
ncbi:hypothetical protein SAMN05444392_11170 [Seinonella peptonophila]|uniref:Uncharacterized protein n=1 Tax=Seinonella peptonophila TaxID=112248 RepID=A0A1M4ZZS2_9BACL|nr:hypothetical protein [Seinonella peptonophila]SHF23515.1 hypothetical protein SAMN05444392_11170 [Seinonella peptonophila]